MKFRYGVEPADAMTVRNLVSATGKFYAEEVDIAVELVEERLNRGPVSGYEFVFLQRFENGQLPSEASRIESGGQTEPLSNGASEVIGFACYGKIPCTRQAYDLYWIAVHPKYQGQGLGHQLLIAVEQAIRAAGGNQLYADTSGRPDYEATRRFYLATQFEQAACLTEFYGPGDDKIIFRKLVRGS